MGCFYSKKSEKVKQEPNEQEIEEHVTMYTEHHKRRSIEMRKSLEQQNCLGKYVWKDLLEINVWTKNWKNSVGEKCSNTVFSKKQF